MRLAILLFATLAALTCQERLAAPITEITGTWGGDDAGLVVTEGDVHVHIGCTLGDADGPVHPDDEGRFEVTGRYNVDAYPVDIGVYHPARFHGQVQGELMSLTVTLTDTTLQLGPVLLVYGEEPEMGTCPICRP